MDKQQKQVIERLENIVYLYNRESRGWHDCNDIRLNSNDIKAIEKAIELIKDIPSAEPKTGHWIIIDDCEKFIAKCSECGQIEDSRMIGKYAYCHCGARMECEQHG